MKYTVLGANGFIGSHLTTFLEEHGNEVATPDIRKQEIYNETLGNVIYCIGIPNFLERPFDAIEAHACLLAKLLEQCRFDSFLYISSARLYAGLKNTNEDEAILINPSKINDLYNISKAMGESICLASKKEGIKIVRPSNVTGNNLKSNLFIPSIIKDALKNQKIVLHSSFESEKDYVDIDDVINIIHKILSQGKDKIYNIAYGKNTTAREIVNEISRITNCTIDIDENAPEYSFPPISIKKIQNELDFKPSSIIPKLESMIKEFKNNQ